MADLYGVMLGGKFGFLVELILLALMLMVLFSTATKFYALDRNKKAVRYIVSLLKLAGRKLIEANSHNVALSRNEENFFKWIEIGLYCLFSAVFWLYAIGVFALFALSDVSGMQAVFTVMFILGVMMCANMYYVAAKNRRVAA